VKDIADSLVDSLKEGVRSIIAGNHLSEEQALMQRASPAGFDDFFHEWHALPQSQRQRLVEALVASPELEHFKPVVLGQLSNLESSTANKNVDTGSTTEKTTKKKSSSSTDTAVKNKNKKPTSALLNVDVQECFLEGGSLAVPASHILEKIKTLREQKSCLFDHVIWSQDFHPQNHISFASTHGLAPFSHIGIGGLPIKCVAADSVHANGTAACCPMEYLSPGSINCTTSLCTTSSWNYTNDNPGIIEGNVACTVCKDYPEECFETHQEMWTDHCLQEGDSTFPTALGTSKTADDIVIQKGQNKYIDAYSAFFDNSHKDATALVSMVKDLNVKNIFVTGIATDVCVKETVVDALTQVDGVVKEVYVIKDLTEAVMADVANFNKALDDMAFVGAKIVSMDDVLAMQCP